MGEVINIEFTEEEVRVIQSAITYTLLDMNIDISLEERLESVDKKLLKANSKGMMA